MKLDKFEKTLTTLELYWESNKISSFNCLKTKDYVGLNNLVEMLKNCIKLNILKLNIFDKDELDIIVGSLKDKICFNKIQIIFNDNKCSLHKKRITIKKESQFLNID